jgi:hypothetical protein
MISKDLYLGIFLIFLSLFAYIESRSYPVDSRYFPQFIILIIALLGFATLIKELKSFFKRREVDRTGEGSDNGKIAFWRMPSVQKVSMMIISSLIYMVIMGYVGFFVTTTVYLPIMMLLLGIRKARTIVLSTGIVVVLIYLVFMKFLSVPFPEGILI